ncbi:predicted protein [Lichtheimia corymbifera JMRC:FSU:9682]|uniref:Uncharacterized protein n=1 Tax=Lichtheimia corymbifera JMRC:FSU:9682 TaxID=1263082 RepID=A0A068RM32_9FUNG|nr:predicted protein [Lichtheimia corymbifera JMRC:FSU:9682]
MRSNLLALLCMALAMMAHGLPTPEGDDNQAVDNSEHVAIPHAQSVFDVQARKEGANVFNLPSKWIAQDVKRMRYGHLCVYIPLTI